MGGFGIIGVELVVVDPSAEPERMFIEFGSMHTRKGELRSLLRLRRRLCLWRTVCHLDEWVLQNYHTVFEG